MATNVKKERRKSQRERLKLAQKSNAYTQRAKAAMSERPKASGVKTTATRGAAPSMKPVKGGGVGRAAGATVAAKRAKPVGKLAARVSAPLTALAAASQHRNTEQGKKNQSNWAKAGSGRAAAMAGQGDKGAKPAPKKMTPKPAEKPAAKPTEKKKTEKPKETKKDSKPKGDVKPKSKSGKGKFGRGDSKTITHNGRKMANVDSSQLKATGLSLREYMNQWNKTGKRPTGKK